MPKMKTHKASKKRFRVTASGKLKRRQAGKKHLLSHKSGKRKRHLRRPSSAPAGLKRSTSSCWEDKP
jgi:large subunit ribosomal protein L35